METSRLTTLIALLVIISSVGYAQQVTATASNSNQFTIQDSLELRTLTGQSLALSPDGSYVVYLISYLGPESSHDGKHQEMWLVDTKTKQNALINDEAWECTATTWSPDGKRVAFYDKVGSGTGIKIWSLETRKIKLVASDIERGDLLQWSPDGKFVYARRISKPNTEPAAAGTQAKVQAEDSKNGIFVYHSKKTTEDKPDTYFEAKDVESIILAFDVESGAEKVIVRRNKMDSFALSPNGKFIAWTENARAFSKLGSGAVTDIGIVTLATGSAQIVARDFKDPVFSFFYGYAFSWSPDGNVLAVASVPAFSSRHSAKYFVIDANSGLMRRVYTSDRPLDDRRYTILQWVNARQFIVAEGAEGRELWLVSMDGRKPYRVFESTSGNIIGIVLGGSRWDVWHPKPNTFAAFIRRDNDMKVVPVWINYESRSSSESPAMARVTQPTEWLPHGVDSGMAVVELEDPTHPADLWRMSPDGSFEKLTQLNPGIANKKLGNVRLLEWQEDGRPKRAMLLLPPEYVPGKKYPTIVTQYSGFLWTRRLYQFGLTVADGINQQLYASRGYAVLIPDIYVPVSPKESPGPGYYASERPNSLEAIARQVNTAVDFAVQQGYVDPDRLGITGASNGGYGVMCTIVSTPRFKAAIARSTVVDAMSESWQFSNGSGIWASLSESGFGTTIWKDRDLYIANSPFYFLDRVQTPLLLTRGTNDQTVTTQPEQAYIGMKWLGKDVTLVEYEGEGHLDAATYPHRKDLLERMLGFFDEHLKSP